MHELMDRHHVAPRFDSSVAHRRHPLFFEKGRNLIAWKLPVTTVGRGSDQRRTSRCPHSVQFFNLTDDSHRSERAAWAYKAPRASYAHVAHWIGFWNDVELQR
jgi:uncharacterized protein (DUF427 family)